MSELETPTIETTEVQSAPDNSAALAEISSELFGQDDDENTSGKSAEEPGKTTPEEVAGPSKVEEPSPAQNSDAVKETGAPQTWSKEALESWATIPPRAQQEILKREEDMHNGIAQYRQAADIGKAYDSVVEPFRQQLQAERVDPVQLFQSFASNHFLLARGTEQQKLGLAANLLDSYGIDLIQLADFIGNTEPVDPKIATLEQEIAQLRSGQQEIQSREMAGQRARIDQEVEGFANDPSHLYFNELIDDISRLMASGAASSLQQAYDQAVYANPGTRQKEIDRLTAESLSKSTAEAKKRGDIVRRSTAADVTAISKQRDGTVPTGSMDDTLAETLASIRSRA